MDALQSPGVYTLIAAGVTTAQVGTVMEIIEGLEGMDRLTLVAEVLGAGSGSTIAMLAQTSFDGGVTWYDAARFDFTTSPGVKYCVLSRNSKAIAAYAALSVEGVNDGLIGAAFRGKLITVGTYVSTVVSLRLAT